MSRNRLHKTHLANFKSWLDQKGIEHRPPRGDYQVLQVKVGNQWPTIYTKLDAKEHYTVPPQLERLVSEFLGSKNDDHSGFSEWSSNFIKVNGRDPTPLDVWLACHPQSAKPGTSDESVVTETVTAQKTEPVPDSSNTDDSPPWD